MPKRATHQTSYASILRDRIFDPAQPEDRNRYDKLGGN
jgi:hypothetical protein